MKARHLKLFREISEACGVSGYTNEVANIFLREVGKLGIQCSMDATGSVSAFIPSKVKPNDTKNNVMVSAHIDNVGYIVLKIDKKNRELRLAKVGVPYLEGTYPCILRSSRKYLEVMVEDEGEDELYFAKAVVDGQIDIDLVSIGDILYYNNPVIAKPMGKFTGSFMDNKASIMAMLMAIEKIKAAGSNYHNLFFVLTSFEEIGAYGAITATNKIKPRFAINLDVFPVDSKRELSTGAIVSTGYIYNNVLVDYAIDIANEYKVDYRIMVPSPDGESDANYIIWQNGGTPVCEIGAPCLNVHLPDEMISKKGLVSTAKLLTHMCLNTSKITSLVSGGRNGL